MEWTEAEAASDSLAQISTSRLYRAGVSALARLQIWFTGYTHELIGEFAAKASRRLVFYARQDGTLTATEAFQAEANLAGLWGDVIVEWTKTLQKVRHVAAELPFGVMAEHHQRLVRPIVTPPPAPPQMGERHLERGVIREARGAVFDPQLQSLLSAAAEYLYGDGLNLSGRIWKIDRMARDGMNQVLLHGITNGTSAWDLAKEFEVFLGASEDCPRWTSTRLYKRTKTDIAAGDLSGLVRGEACDGQGVAYNALRLARTEIQKVHALATDRVMKQSPWVEQEQVHLSTAHPETDICDDTVAAGEKGEGIYPVGTVELPLHPNCLCYKTAVLMEEKQFTGELRDWMRGGSSWPEMDAYAQSIGGDVQVDMGNSPALLALGVWLFGQVLKP
jgi:hypothetical protein